MALPARPGFRPFQPNRSAAPAAPPPADDGDRWWEQSFDSGPSQEEPPLREPSSTVVDPPRPAPARRTPQAAPKADDSAGYPAGTFVGADPLHVLSKVWGHPEFRMQQRAAIDRVIDGGNAIALMPTGGGKSITFQVPALVRPGCAVVVSPLIALMKDQVRTLVANGVAADYLSSDRPDSWSVLERFRSGGLDLLYVSPERFILPDFRRTLDAIEISMFALDEAHCVSQWGHDFRSDYLGVGEICQSYDVPRIAVTATASPPVLEDMKTRLGLTDAPVFKSSFDRPNISYEIVEKQNGAGQMKAFLASMRGQSGIVYCRSRKRTEELATELFRQGYDAVAFHAGLSKEEKNETQTRFMEGEGVIVCATIAFGMGIDKPNVRFVAHDSMPDSIEAYYQETGRAGRDGLPAKAWMSYGMGDAARRYDQIAKNEESTEEGKEMAKRRLQRLTGIIESPVCRRKAILTYFGEEHPGNCANCDRCRSPVATFDGTIEAQKFLKAMKETGQRFGAGHLSDILTGHATPKVVQFKHDKRESFGMGRAHPKKWWENIGRQLLSSGFVETPPDSYGGLKMTKSGLAVLNGTTGVRLVEPRGENKLRADRPSTDSVNILTEGLSERRKAAWDGLRAWRTHRAAAQGLPPYVIFDDKTMLNIVSRMPTELSELAVISGIGENRLRRYGSDIIRVLNQYKDDVAPPQPVPVKGFGRF